ncbi:MAG: hypothetical protein D6725_01520 [Planctomycetota bacterium]|nr:MAG: hypothetical protein D6725_01520 [Planctomycetota bacterium]
MVGVRHKSVCAWIVLLLAFTTSSVLAGPWNWFGSRPKDQSRAQWYAARAHDPVGARQWSYKGKLWPPYPRPTGPAQLPIHKYHAAHYWPWPYQCYDRASVREFSRQQVDNGWVAATTLYDYHFDPDTHELNLAGQEQLRRIIELTPSERRVAFVQAARSESASEKRVASVRSAAIELVGEANLPPIMLRVTRPLGRPAGEIETIRKNYLDTIPSPRITDPITSGGSGSTGSQTIPQ